MNTPQGLHSIEREFSFGAFFFFVIVLFSSTELAAQWKHVTQLSEVPGEQPPVYSIMFLDQQGAPEIGFASTYHSGVYGQLWRTTDAGESWASVKKFEPDCRYILQLAFKDKDTGWLASTGMWTENQGGCWKTTDGGSSWIRLDGTEGPCVGVYYHKPTDHLFLSRRNLPSLSSSNGGVSWSQFGSGCENGIAFMNDYIGVASPSGINYGMCDYAPYQLTTDGGITWFSNSGSLGDSWQPLALKRSNTFLAIGHRRDLYASTDNGITWSIRKKFDVSTTEGPFVHLAQTECLTVLQSFDFGFSVSTDEGYTWHHIGGPANAFWSRFYVTGNTIWAGDPGGGIWRNDVSGYMPKPLSLAVDTLESAYRVNVAFPLYIPIPYLPIDSITFIVHHAPDALTILEEDLDKAWQIASKETLSAEKTRYSLRYLGGFPRVDSSILSFVIRPNLTVEGNVSKFIIGDVTFDSLSNFYVDCMGKVDPPQQELSLTLQGCEAKYISERLRSQKSIAIKSINPNPTNGSITIEYDSKLSGAVTLSVYSVNGVLVHEEVLATDPSHKPIQLDASGWASGAYTIVLKSGDEEASASLIKN